jgi:hypothetical protein
LPIPQAEHGMHDVQPTPTQKPIPSVHCMQDTSFPMLLLNEPIWHGLQIVLFDLLQPCKLYVPLSHIEQLEQFNESKVDVYDTPSTQSSQKISV